MVVLDLTHINGKDVNLFQKGHIIDMHQAKKTSKEIAETIKIRLRTVQRIIKNWKEVEGGTIIFEEEMWLKKNLE